jgi:hypothetical protein
MSHREERGSGAIRMPFGKFRDLPLSEINSGYLRFVLVEYGDWGPDLLADIRDELNRRARLRVSRCPLSPSLLRSWRKRLEARYAKSPTALKAIREADDRLDDMLIEEVLSDSDRRLKR